MTAGDPPKHQQRWLSCKNVSSETAPPYALLVIQRDANPFVDTSDGSAPLLAGEIRNQQFVWHVGKPNDGAEDIQDVTMFAANGPTPIPAGGYGVCTQDWPALVKRAETDVGAEWSRNYAEARRYDLVGAKEDNWGVAHNGGTGDAFRVLSYLSDEGIAGTNDSPTFAPRTKVWVQPAWFRRPPFVNIHVSGTTSQEFEILNLWNSGNPVTSAVGYGFAQDPDVQAYFYALRTGIYKVSMDLMVQSTAAAHDSVIGLTLVNPGGSSVSAFRRQFVVSVDEYHEEELRDFNRATANAIVGVDSQADGIPYAMYIQTLATDDLVFSGNISMHWIDEINDNTWPQTLPDYEG